MYGQGEAGADVVENLTYTVSDGIATVNYNGQQIKTTKIENDTFKASLDGTEENTATFTTKANPAPADPETPVKPADPEKPTEPTDPEKPAEPTDPETPVENPFAGKTFYGTGYGSSYDICKLDFTSDLKATLTYYGLGEAGDDLVFNSTYTVSDGIATLDYQGDKVTTTKIENDTFKVSKDGTEENTISFTTKANPAPAEPETPVEPTDPEKPVENPFAGKTFYGKFIGYPYPYDVCKLNFTSDSEVTLTLYGEVVGGNRVENLTYTVSDGIATLDNQGQKITTTKIENDTFKLSYGTEAPEISFTTEANPAPVEPETPVEPTDPEIPVENLFAGKTFYGTVDGYPYDVCKLDFTSDSEVTLTLYGQGEAGADLVENYTYKVFDGIAIVDYKGQKLITTKIENDTFKASLDGTEENTASFTTNANPAPVLDEAGITGGFTGWSPEPLTKVDNTTYTYDFTATVETIQFVVQKTLGSWDDGRWGGSTVAAPEASEENVGQSSLSVSLNYSNITDNKITGLSINSKYSLIITIDDAESNLISVIVKLVEYVAPPSNYNLKGLWFKGAWASKWGDIITLTDEATQTYTIKADNADDTCNEFGIFGSSGTVWYNDSVPFDKETELTYYKDGDAPSNAKMAENFEFGVTYEVVIKVTDDNIDAPKLTIKITKQ